MRYPLNHFLKPPKLKLGPMTLGGDCERGRVRPETRSGREPIPPSDRGTKGRAQCRQGAPCEAEPWRRGHRNPWIRRSPAAATALCQSRGDTPDASLLCLSRQGCLALTRPDQLAPSRAVRAGRAEGGSRQPRAREKEPAHASRDFFSFSHVSTCGYASFF